LEMARCQARKGQEKGNARRREKLGIVWFLYMDLIDPRVVWRMARLARANLRVDENSPRAEAVFQRLWVRDVGASFNDFGRLCRIGFIVDSVFWSRSSVSASGG